MKNILAFLLGLVAFVLMPILSNAGPPITNHANYVVLQTHTQQFNLESFETGYVEHVVLQTYNSTGVLEAPMVELSMNGIIVAENTTIRLCKSDSYYDERVHPPDNDNRIYLEYTINYNTLLSNNYRSLDERYLIPLRFY